MAARTLILGLGNPILGDDGIGIAVARELKERLAGQEVDVTEASLGGLALLDLIAGYEMVIVVDAIITTGDSPPGTVYSLGLDELGSVVNPYASHALDLKTTIELGTSVGYEMPVTVRIHAVEIRVSTEFTSEMSPEVARTVPEMARRVMEDLGL
jgi:hydrogenase maturation protease